MGLSAPPKESGFSQNFMGDTKKAGSVTAAKHQGPQGGPRVPPEQLQFLKLL